MASSQRRQALRGKLAGHYRMRTGDYRVQFHVTTIRATDEQGKVSKTYTIHVEKAGHRDGFYEG